MAEGEEATYGEEHRDLRESNAWKEMWWAWARHNAGGTRDPSRMTLGAMAPRPAVSRGVNGRQMIHV
eukprot:gene30039-24771_t